MLSGIGNELENIEEIGNHPVDEMLQECYI